jgi:hypothetical protein
MIDGKRFLAAIGRLPQVDEGRAWLPSKVALLHRHKLREACLSELADLALSRLQGKQHGNLLALTDSKKNFTQVPNVLIVCSSAGQGKTILPLCPKGSRLL